MEGQGEAEGFNPAKLRYHGWYPTLEKTVKLLAGLYLALDSGPFNGLAREATLACAQTLCAAARLIEKKVRTQP